MSYKQDCAREGFEFHLHPHCSCNANPICKLKWKTTRLCSRHLTATKRHKARNLKDGVETVATHTVKASASATRSFLCAFGSFPAACGKRLIRRLHNRSQSGSHKRGSFTALHLAWSRSCARRPRRAIRSQSILSYLQHKQQFVPAARRRLSKPVRRTHYPRSLLPCNKPRFLLRSGRPAALPKDVSRDSSDQTDTLRVCDPPRNVGRPGHR